MKAKNKFIAILLCLIGTLTIAACQQNDPSSKLKQQISQTKEKIFKETPKKTLLSEKFTPLMASYQVEKLRDPFEAPHLISMQPAAEASPLNAFPLTELRFIGVVIENEKKFAILMTPNDHTYKVTLGDQIGNQYGKIVNINQSQIDVVETVKDENNRPIQHTVVIRFKG